MSPTPIFGPATGPHVLDLSSRAESQLHGRRVRQARLASLDPLDSYIQPYEADHAPVVRHPAMAAA
jgi:hypothetical protein